METQTGLGATTQGQLGRKTSQNWSYNAIMFSVVLTRRTCPTTPASTTSTLSGSLSPLPFSCFPLSYSPFFRGQFSRFHIRDGRGRYLFHGARENQKSMRQAGQDKDSQLDCDILFLRYEIEKRLRAVYSIASHLAIKQACNTLNLITPPRTLDLILWVGTCT